MRNTKIPKKKFSLSLNAAFYGFFAHAGFLQGLEGAGQVPARISGSSAGAMVAALYAFDVSTEEMIEVFLRLKKKDFWEGGVFPQFMKFLRHGRRGYSGILSGKKLRVLLSKWLHNKKIEEAKIPLFISVANLTNQKSEVVSKGDVIDAVLASMAFPILFEVQNYLGHEYIDGGLADEEPVKPFLKNKDKIIISHDILREEKVSRNVLARALDGGRGVIANETRELKEEIAKLKKLVLHRFITHTPAINHDRLDLGIRAVEFGRVTGKKVGNFLSKL